jgi:RNA polymerase sigma-70 factor (ECF subfamily)
MREPETRSPTLGDVVYANQSATVVVEKDWTALVHAIAAGDQVALHALYERSHRLVFTLVMRITANRETAEELTLDVFHDVWRRASTYDVANGTVLGWIMNQARSRAIDRLRFEHRKKRTDPHAGEPGDETTHATDELLQLAQDGRRLRAALSVLTSDEQAVIEAAFFGGMTHAEVATRLEQPLGTIKTRIRSALHKLRLELETEARR